MKLPELEKPQNYVGLYVFDFGDYCSVGYTAEEIAAILESEKFADGKVYKIHRANPDGTMELKGVPAERFQLEAGMMFYAEDEDTARDDFNRLAKTAKQTLPPCRAKLHLARLNEGRFAVALIYPAEYDDEVSSWLIRIGYKTQGLVEGGTSVVSGYYDGHPEVFQKEQLWPQTATQPREIEQLLQDINEPVQRKLA